MQARACRCGAVTVVLDGESYSMRERAFRQHFGSTRVIRRDAYCGCNHCINKWGIDLCGCGSGKPVGRCDGGYAECRACAPAQQLPGVGQAGKTHPIGGWV